MHRYLKTFGFACAMLAALSAHAASAGDITLRAVKVSPHVYFFEGAAGMASAANKGYMSNAGFVVTDAGVVMFDALATPALGQAMVKAIRKVTSQAIRRVIISHYHADHFYGLQVLKDQGVEVWAHENARATLASDETQARLKQRRADLAPWVNSKTRLIPADRWLHFNDGKMIPFEMGGLHFRVIDSSGAHSPEDIMLFVEEDRVLFAGDLFFTGRIPYVGGADSKHWLEALDRMLEVKPAIVIPGHGRMSDQPLQDMQLTRDYLLFLRQKMGAAAADMVPFEEAYAATDWSAFEKYPAFGQANRLNAYGTYLLMEKESLGGR